jgi:hypothetical protein
LQSVHAGGARSKRQYTVSASCVVSYRHSAGPPCSTSPHRGPAPRSRLSAGYRGTRLTPRGCGHLAETTGDAPHRFPKACVVGIPRSARRLSASASSRGLPLQTPLPRCFIACQRPARGLAAGRARPSEADALSASLYPKASALHDTGVGTCFTALRPSPSCFFSRWVRRIVTLHRSSFRTSLHRAFARSCSSNRAAPASSNGPAMHDRRDAVRPRHRAGSSDQPRDGLTRTGRARWASRSQLAASCRLRALPSDTCRDPDRRTCRPAVAGGASLPLSLLP